MKEFRLPRKIKKRLSKTLYLYPPDKDGSSLMAVPKRSQEDYDALKKGIVKKFPDSTKKERRKFIEQIDKEIFIEDQILKTYINDMIREDLRTSSYNILIRAKNSPKAIRAYFNFINAYHFYKQGEESYGNICCLAIDSARKLLKTRTQKH